VYSTAKVTITKVTMNKTTATFDNVWYVKWPVFEKLFPASIPPIIPSTRATVINNCVTRSEMVTNRDGLSIDCRTLVSRPRVASRRGEKPIFWQTAAPMYKLIFDGSFSSPNCRPAPIIRRRENVIRRTQPDALPNPWRTASNMATSSMGKNTAISATDIPFLSVKVILVVGCGRNGVEWS